MAYDDYKAGCLVIKEYVDTAIGNIAQPSSLPQTYKKKAVTLAKSGWTADNNLPLSFPIAADKSKTTVIYGDFSAYRLITDKTKWNCSYTLTKSDGTKENYNWQSAYSISVGSYYPETYVYFKDSHAGTYSEYPVEVRVYNNRIEIGPMGTISLTSLGAGIALQKQSYTDADVKINSAVRFTLDEKNGKLAGQFRVKKTIDKEAGKLTFTAGTLPTSAITGTLEIGETSTEGAAFIEGITSDTDIPQRTTKDTTLTAAGWANNQQEVSVGDLSPTDDVSPIFATDSAEQAYKDAEITGKIGTNKVVFTCQSVPTADIPLTLVITRW